MLNALKAILPAEATLVSFDYDKKVFGNMIVEIELEKIKHTFITDRGEIFHNGVMLCDSSYLCMGEGTFPKLLQLIQREFATKS